METGLEYTQGSAEELVYRDTYANDLLSHLNWPIPPSLGIRFTLTKEWPDWMALLSLKGSWALATGIMADDDWNVDSSTTRIHSDSTSYMKSDWEAYLEFGKPFHLSPVQINALMGIQYRQMTWEARDVYQTATYSTGATSSVAVNGLTITYRQEWLIPYLHGQASLRLGPWQGTLGLKFSPFLVCFDLDEHLAKYMTFQDVGWGGFLLQPELLQEFWLDDFNAVGLQLTAVKSWGTRGNTTYYTNGLTSFDPQTTNYTAGMLFSLITVKVGYKMRF